MQFNGRRSYLHVAALNRGKFENIVNQPVHSRSVLADNRKKPVITLLIFHCTCFQRLDKSKDGRKRGTKLVRYVRKEFLPHTLKAFDAGYVEKNTESTFWSAAVTAG